MRDEFNCYFGVIFVFKGWMERFYYFFCKYVSIKLNSFLVKFYGIFNIDLNFVKEKIIIEKGGVGR